MSHHKTADADISKATPDHQNTAPEANIGNATSTSTQMSFTQEQLNALIQSAITFAQAQSPSAQSPPQYHTPRPNRPSIDLDVTEGRWAFFVNEWGLYKQQARLPENAPTELRSCCSEDLRLMLFELEGSSIDNLDEKSLLQKIRQTAVKKKNTAIHRQEFYSMKQDQGQTTQQFLSMLKSKADHCNFQIECSSEACNHKINSYKSIMIADILTVGCADQDIQEELLVRSATTKTLEEKIELMQAMESGKSARTDINGHSSVQAQRSTKPHDSNSKGCQGCGSLSHGPGTSLPRKNHCPA